MQVKFKAKLDQDGPVIVSFAGGCPPKETKSARFKLFGHSDKRKAHQRILEGETDAMRYSSRNFGAGAGKKTHSNFAVGVVKKSAIEGDPAHVTVKLLPVRTAAFAMTHSVKANESKQSVVSDNSSVDYATKRQLLVDEFGSKKRQRIVRSNQANRVNLDEGSADRLLQTTVGSTNKVDTLEFALTRTWVPPHDATASDPVEVYNLETMVGAEAWAALADSGKAMIKLAKKTCGTREGEPGRSREALLRPTSYAGKGTAEAYSPCSGLSRTATDLLEVTTEIQGQWTGRKRKDFRGGGGALVRYVHH